MTTGPAISQRSPLDAPSPTLLPRKLVFVKERPHLSRRIDAAAMPPDHPLRCYPLAAGPLMAFSLDRVEHHVRIVSAIRVLQARDIRSDRRFDRIRPQWFRRDHYPQAKRLLITADAGGSNGSRLRLWKTEIQKLADEMKIPISICHFPPGTSKWNKIEHRLFSFISQNWRGKPLITHAVIVKLIAATRTKAGLKVRARLDPNSYPDGRKVSQAELETVRLRPDSFHGDWNYTILPHMAAPSRI
jgi:Rhodopirellula transposase DDE domain